MVCTCAEYCSVGSRWQAVIGTLTDSLGLSSGGSKYGVYQCPNFGALTVEARLLSTNPGVSTTQTLGGVVETWTRQPAATLTPGTTSRRAAFRMVFMRRLFFPDMVSTSTRGDIRLL